MAAYNIVNTDNENTGYSSLKDPVMVSSVENFLETIEHNGVISRGMVVSLEETIADKVITDKYSLNMFTNEPSKVGIQEATKVIKNVLSGDDVVRDVVYTLQDVVSVFTKNINLLNELREKLNYINDNLDLELVEKIKSGEVKAYNNEDVLVDIKELDIVDLVKYGICDKETSTLFNTTALEIVNRPYEENENLTSDMIFLRLFTLIGLKEDAVITDLLSVGLIRYTVGDIVDKLSYTSTLIDAIDETKQHMITGYRILNGGYFDNRIINRHYKIYSKMFDILKDDLTIPYLILFTKK